jgi:hypothetical protein
LEPAAPLSTQSAGQQAEDARRRMREAAERLTLSHGRDVVREKVASRLASGGVVGKLATEALAAGARRLERRFPDGQRTGEGASPGSNSDSSPNSAPPASSPSLSPLAVASIAVGAGLALAFFPPLRRVVKVAAMTWISRQIGKKL